MKVFDAIVRVEAGLIMQSKLLQILGSSIYAWKHNKSCLWNLKASLKKNGGEIQPKQDVLTCEIWTEPIPPCPIKTVRSVQLPINEQQLHR